MNATIKTLNETIENLKKINDEQAKEILRLKSKNDKDSSNSSKPSSTNGFKKVITNEKTIEDGIKSIDTLKSLMASMPNVYSSESRKEIKEEIKSRTSRIREMWQLVAYFLEESFKSVLIV